MQRLLLTLVIMFVDNDPFGAPQTKPLIIGYSATWCVNCPGWQAYTEKELGKEILWIKVTTLPDNQGTAPAFKRTKDGAYWDWSKASGKTVTAQALRDWAK